MTTKIIKKISALILGILLVIIFSWKLTASFNYDNDFGRDIYDILGIVRGELRLLGPRLSFGGFISGPYYYYLFAIPMFFGENPASLLYFSVLIYGLVFVLFFLSKAGKNNVLAVAFFTLWIATSSYMLFSVRNPGNAFSYFWLWLIFLFLSGQTLGKVGPLLRLGVVAGVIANFHFVNLIIFAVFAVIWAIREKSIKKPAIFLLGMGIAFIPQILFELRHGFVMIRNTFSARSYMNFTDRVLPTALPVSKNPVVNFFLVRKYINDWVQFDIGIVLALILGFYAKNYRSFVKKTKIWVETSIIAFIVLLIVARYQFVFHYFLPFVLLLQISLFLVIKNRILKTLIFGLFLIVNILGFPKGLYSVAPRQLDDYEKLVKGIIERRLVAEDEKFNLFVVRETPFAVAGHEYRFFLKKYGYDPMDTFSYSGSDKMIIIGESGQHIDPSDLQTWEFEQFGEYKSEENQELRGREIRILTK